MLLAKVMDRDVILPTNQFSALGSLLHDNADSAAHPPATFDDIYDFAATKSKLRLLGIAVDEGSSETLSESNNFGGNSNANTAVRIQGRQNHLPLKHVLGRAKELDEQGVEVVEVTCPFPTDLNLAEHIEGSGFPGSSNEGTIDLRGALLDLNAALTPTSLLREAAIAVADAISTSSKEESPVVSKAGHGFTDVRYRMPRECSNSSQAFASGEPASSSSSSSSPNKGTPSKRCRDLIADINRLAHLLVVKHVPDTQPVLLSGPAIHPLLSNISTGSTASKHMLLLPPAFQALTVQPPSLLAAATSSRDEPSRPTSESDLSETRQPMRLPWFRHIFSRLDALSLSVNKAPAAGFAQSEPLPMHRLFTALLEGEGRRGTTETSQKNTERNMVLAALDYELGLLAERVVANGSYPLDLLLVAHRAHSSQFSKSSADIVYSAAPSAPLSRALAPPPLPPPTQSSSVRQPVQQQQQQQQLKWVFVIQTSGFFSSPHRSSSSSLDSATSNLTSHRSRTFQLDAFSEYARSVVVAVDSASRDPSVLPIAVVYIPAKNHSSTASNVMDEGASGEGPMVWPAPVRRLISWLISRGVPVIRHCPSWATSLPPLVSSDKEGHAEGATSSQPDPAWFVEQLMYADAPLLVGWTKAAKLRREVVDPSAITPSDLHGKNSSPSFNDDHAADLDEVSARLDHSGLAVAGELQHDFVLVASPSVLFRGGSSYGGLVATEAEVGATSPAKSKFLMKQWLGNDSPLPSFMAIARDIPETAVPSNKRGGGGPSGSSSSSVLRSDRGSWAMGGAAATEKAGWALDLIATQGIAPFS
jgi:hypothetical protein